MTKLNKNPNFLITLLIFLTFLIAIPLLFGCDDSAKKGNNSDNFNPKNDDDDSLEDDYTDEDVVIDPLPAGAVPYLMGNALPVPSHRYFDGTIIRSLNGTWKFAIDPDEVGEEENWFDEQFDKSGWDEIEVPSSYNAEFENLLDYRGVGWYARSFDMDEKADDYTSTLLHLK